MNEAQLIEAVEDMSPQAQFFMIALIGNCLREAVDEGRCSISVLQQATDHLKMLTEHGPAAHGRQ